MRPRLTEEPTARASLTKRADLVPHRLTNGERRIFEDTGFLVVPNALSAEQVSTYKVLHEEIYREDQVVRHRLTPAGGLSNRQGSMHSFGFVFRHPCYLELLDLPTTFPKVIDILGWNIFVYHSHIDRHPPLRRRLPPVWAWHQDGGRQNVDIETNPRPRLSVKVTFFLTDLSEPGGGNLKLIPGSHRQNQLARPQEPTSAFQDPAGAIELCVTPGTAVLLDRRIWHSRSDNLSSTTRLAFTRIYLSVDTGTRRVQD